MNPIIPHEDYYYFAYGSNLNQAQMTKRCPSAEVYGKAVLKGYKIEFRHVANIVTSKGSKVLGVIYKMLGEDVIVLDRFEGHPQLYIRFPVKIEMLERGIQSPEHVFTYRMVQDKIFVIRTGELLPTMKYFNVILRGYRNFGFPEKILDKAYIEADEKTEKNLEAGYWEFPWA